MRLGSACCVRAPLRQRHANLPNDAREQAEVRLLVQEFAEKAPAASRLQLAPAAKRLRAAAHAEAKRLGILTDGAGDESAGTRCVVLIQAPPCQGD